MNRVLPAFAVLFALNAAPAVAQDQTEAESLMERGTQLLLEGLMQQMEPALDNLQNLAEEFGPALRNFASEMGPALTDLLEQVEDWSLYHPPEILDNGDIIIRRKEKDPIVPPEGEIEI